MKKYESKVAAVITGMLGYGAEAEDIGQETFMRFYKSLQRFKGEKLSEMREKIRQEFLPINKAMEEELNSVLTPEQKKRLEKRFFRRGPGGFFRPPRDRHPGDRPPGPPWPGDKPPHPPWQQEHPKQKEKTVDQ